MSSSHNSSEEEDSDRTPEHNNTTPQHAADKCRKRIAASAIPLKPVVKDYAWGIRGMDSRVGRYALTSGSIDSIDPDCPYAELWIGTHPSGPATLQDEQETPLQEAVGGELPFLFKILSAGKALSIQAHPDKDVAARLHAQHPQAYADANHKPEMAIALTPFEAMCGFRRIEEISVLLKKHPEFAACLTEEAKLAVFLAASEASQRAALQKMFASFMACDPKVSEHQLQLLLLRLQAEQSNVHPHPHDEPPVCFCCHCCLLFYNLLYLSCQWLDLFDFIRVSFGIQSDIVSLSLVRVNLCYSGSAS